MSLLNINLSQNNQGNYPQRTRSHLPSNEWWNFHCGEFLSLGKADTCAFYIWTFGLWPDIVRIYPGGFLEAFDLERKRNNKRVKTAVRPAIAVQWAEFPGKGYSLLLPVWIVALAVGSLVPTFDTLLYWFLLGFNPFANQLLRDRRLDTEIY